MLLKVNKYNDLPGDMVPKMPEEGTEVVFRFLKKIYDPHANKGNALNTYPEHVPIPATSRVRGEDGRWYDIGLVRGWDDEKKCIIPMEWPVYNFSPQKLGGLLKITIGHNADTDALYQYLMLIPEVRGNNNTTTTDQPILEYVDYEAAAKADRAARALRKEASNIAFGMDDAQVMQLAHILRLDTKAEPDILRNEIEDYAERDPQLFLNKIKDESAQYKARFMQAMSLGVVAYNPDTQFVYWNDNQRNEIFKVSNATSDNMQAEYVEFVQNNAGGLRIDEAIAAQIKISLGEVKTKGKKKAVA